MLSVLFATISIKRNFFKKVNVYFFIALKGITLKILTLLTTAIVMFQNGMKRKLKV